MKKVISLIIILAAFASGSVFGQSTNDTLKITTIKVSGISCNGDMPLIKKKLINQEGVDEVNYTEAKSGSVTFTIKYHTSIITEKKIREIIEASPSCDNPNVFPYKTKPVTPKKSK